MLIGGTRCEASGERERETERERERDRQTNSEHLRVGISKYL
jgi:hypothetical protein